MLRVRQLLRHSRNTKAGVHVYVDGKLQKGVTNSEAWRAMRNRGVQNWVYNDVLEVHCNIVQYPPLDLLTVAKLCGTCLDKSLSVRINNGPLQHIYSTHPVKDNQVVRKWYVDRGVLYIFTWPWCSPRRVL